MRENIAAKLVNIDMESTIMELDEFMQTPVYRDYLKELSLKIDMLNDALADVNLECTGRHYDLFRGGLKNANELMGVFEMMRDNKESYENAQKGVKKWKKI
jgi:hypothetical protein